MEYGLGKLPFKIQTFITHKYYTAEKKFNQNNGTRFGFNAIALKDIYVVVVVLCDLETNSHSMRSQGFRLPTTFCAEHKGH